MEKITFADLDLPLDAAPELPKLDAHTTRARFNRPARAAHRLYERRLFQLQNVREFVLMRDRECACLDLEPQPTI